ncbi:hypothetical protein ACFPZL_06480 [Leucobacter soli]|uniref:Uncharacterized protein n=1 Tax=Leucobacter soli TaxID=2812850 RepID=A0A916JZI7_9MICO|nr:hypothetical protein [Leucobacter soli]CAG7617482.1 hypothetical protein LEUCIP111803_02105 [Leucobacter soli]
MAGHAARSSRARRALIAVGVVAALVLIGSVTAIVAPILSHRSAGGSGQSVPDGFVPATSATGADGRTRSLEIESPDGAPANLAELSPGDVLVVRGSGFDPGIGIYVGICAVPEPGEKPMPCLGGLPEDAMEEQDPDAVGGAGSAAADPQASVWITDDWAWRSFATQGYDDPATGGFTARLLVPGPSQSDLDCTAVRCAVTTRADHTAGSDRVQDMQLPVAFAD